MGSNTSTSLSKEYIDEIARETGFSREQIMRLHARFTLLDKSGAGYLTRPDFDHERTSDWQLNPVNNRIIEVLINDHGQNDRLDFKQFVKVLSIFRRQGKSDHAQSNKNDDANAIASYPNSKENKLKFLFSIYDRDKDNKINKHELLSILKMLVGKEISNEQLNPIAERAIAELDENGDNVITFEEFCETLKKIDVDERMSLKFSK